MGESQASFDESFRWNALLDRGLERCRTGQWDTGLEDLTLVYSGAGRNQLPGLFYSYLGYGLARCKGQVKEGVRLCRHAVKLEFYQPEAYLNLAKTLLLGKQRRAACEAIRDGLKIDADHPQLTKLWESVGRRKKPVIGFLSRRNLFNRILGRLRHDIKRDKKPDKNAAASTNRPQRPPRRPVANPGR